MVKALQTQDTPSKPKVGHSKASDRILDTAIRLFCENGITATGVDRIIEESGVARMTLYNRFGSKQGLIRAALDREGEAWRTWFTEALKDVGKTADDKLIGIFTILENWFSRKDFFGCAFINTVAEQNKSDFIYRELAIGHKTQVLAIIENLAKEASYTAPKDVAHQLGILMDGAIVAAMITGNAKIGRDAKGMAEVLLQAHPKIDTPNIITAA